ncbi:MAG: hypothetical protein WD907_06520, partial [Bacilli bacterium]
MKKFSVQLISIAVALFLVVLLTGCGNSNENSNQTNDQKSNTDQKQNNQETPAKEEPASNQELPKLDKKLVLKMSHGQSENTEQNQAGLMFAKKVLERTNGMIEMQMFPNSSLASNADGFEQAKIGTPIMQFINADFFGDISPDIMIFGRPFLV